MIRPPVITTLSPSQRTVGTAAFLLTVDGTDFIDEGFSCDCANPQHSRIIFDGNVLTTTFVSPTRLTATVPGPLAGPPRTVNVTVQNPQVDPLAVPSTGAISAPATFTIVAAPTRNRAEPH